MPVKPITSDFLVHWHDPLICNFYRLAIAHNVVHAATFPDATAKPMKLLLLPQGEK